VPTNLSSSGCELKLPGGCGACPNDLSVINKTMMMMMIILFMFNV